MSKKSLKEKQICDQYITPAIVGAGWDEHRQIRREYYFTDGRVIVRGKLATRGKRKFADYLLQYNAAVPLAVVEAKDNKHPVGGGMQQALDYAEALDLPFVFASNGDGFVFHDRTGQSDKVETQLALHQFPSPEELWRRYRVWKGLETVEQLKLATFPFHDDGSGKEPRYYQRIAIQRTVEAVARGQRRVLLLMATGTGKTYTSFQIIWRLWKAGNVKRVLFLVDRNFLADAAMTNDFKPFGQVMTKIKDRTIDKSYEVYLALYQAITGTEEEKNIYKEFSRDFFDLIVIDECHRGSAHEESAWRDVLDWFEPAVHLGLTATPKETTDVSTKTYFGEPVYTYSLKQGIQDGFLAPYKVVRIDLDRDAGWRPEKGKVDKHGREVEDRVYNQRDMDRQLILEQRNQRVAERVVEYLQAVDPYGKTIVFCEDIAHAERMRSQLVNAIGVAMPEEKENLRFVVRITGDSKEGKAELDNFIHREKRYPVIATTSKLLTTGLDAKTCKLVVFDQRVGNLGEFKQMVGRGTRIDEEMGKLWFTIMDFKRATELFADPDFDGEPVIIYTPEPDGPVDPPDEIEGSGQGADEDPGEDDTLSDPPPDGDTTAGPGEGPPGGTVRYYIDDVSVTITTERVQYYDSAGKLVTESLKDFTRRTVNERYSSLDSFIREWSEAEKKKLIVDELRSEGVFFEELRSLVGKDLDPFDLVCHVVFDQPPLTRAERADNVRKRDAFTRYGEQARNVLDALLDKYADEGVFPDQMEVLRVPPLSEMGTLLELVNAFGGRDGYFSAVHDLEQALYGLEDTA